ARAYQIVAVDPDGDQITFTLLNAPGFARLDAIDSVAGKATLLITPQQGDPVVTNNVRVALKDSKGATFTTLPFRIVISDVENDETRSGQGPAPGPGGPGPTPTPTPGNGNRPPVAKAAALPATAQATSKQGASIHLDGSQSSDPDGDTLTYSWKDGSNVIAT